MKKTTRVLVALLALTLVTSCFVGGTFAKYVTTAQGNDSARVAAFGVTITATNDTAFAEKYADDNTDDNVGGFTVVAAEKVVAPGTKGTLTATTIEGEPEVAVEVKYVADLTLTGWDASGYYCPIEIKVGDTTYKGLDYASISEFETAVEAAIAGSTAKYAPGTDLSDADVVAAPSVSWAWAFDTNDDAKDTVLGDAAADGNASTIALKLDTTVTQLD